MILDKEIVNRLLCIDQLNNVANTRMSLTIEFFIQMYEHIKVYVVK